VQHGVGGDAGVIDQDADRAERLLDRGHAGAAGREIGDVPAKHRDAGLLLHAAGAFLVAVKGGGHPAPAVAQGLRDRPAEPARAARYHRCPCH
jgi:hypothetical protein